MTHDDTIDGTRTTRDLEFVSKRTIDVAGERLHRLYFVDAEGEPIAALVAPSRTRTIAGLRTGDTYTVESALVCVRPPRPSRDSSRTCPNCGGVLRAGRALDALAPALRTAVDELRVDGPFLVVDEETTLERTSADAHRPRPERSPLSHPDVVCRACGRRFDESELDADGGDLPVNGH